MWFRIWSSAGVPSPNGRISDSAARLTVLAVRPLYVFPNHGEERGQDTTTTFDVRPKPNHRSQGKSAMFGVAYSALICTSSRWRWCDSAPSSAREHVLRPANDGNGGSSTRDRNNKADDQRARTLLKDRPLVARPLHIRGPRRDRRRYERNMGRPAAYHSNTSTSPRTTQRGKPQRLVRFSPCGRAGPVPRRDSARRPLRCGSSSRLLPASWNGSFPRHTLRRRRITVANIGVAKIQNLSRSRMCDEASLRALAT